MASDDIAPDESSATQTEPTPELADVWVWGVRKVAGMFAEWLIISRGIIVFFILITLGYWVATHDTWELYQAGAGVVALCGVGHRAPAWAICLDSRLT